ncbi:MAG: sulfurtransferase complex subunit TusD [Proteobacteria bacterium]|nr:sulfurtransferase complex subunit TusD [Pseudomonadota bacterium]
MIFALAVHGAPYASQSADSAWHFASAVLAAGHEINRVFFYHDGVMSAGDKFVAPQDQDDAHQKWVELSNTHGVELAICIAAALKRGMLDHDEAERYERTNPTIDPAFTVVGLGQLIDAVVTCDRFVSFAA